MSLLSRISGVLPGWGSFQVSLVVSSSSRVVRQETGASDKGTHNTKRRIRSAKSTVLACTDGVWEGDGGPVIELRLAQYRLHFL